MRKSFQFFAGCLLSVCLLGGAVAFTACGNTSDSTGTSASTSASASSEEEETNGYKFTVLYPDGTPVVGVQVQLCKGDDFCLMPVGTNDAGYALVKCDADVYDIHLLNVPSGYTFDKDAFKTGAAYEEITLRLVAAE